MYPSDVPPPEYIPPPQPQPQPKPQPQPPPPPPPPYPQQMPTQINADVFVIQSNQLRPRFGNHPVNMTCPNCNNPVKYTFLI